MPGTAQQTNLDQWFDWFRTMKADCAAINGTVAAMDLPTFGGATVTNILPSTNDQGEFILRLDSDLQIQVAASDLTAYPTFKGLLDHFMFLEMKLADYLQTMAAGSYPGGTLSAFYNAVINSAFPGGSAASPWKNANDALVNILPADCYTGKLQTSAAKTVDDSSKKISDLVRQIAALG